MIPKGYRPNPDKEARELIIEGLHRNRALHGKPYCPCSLIRNDDTVCPCKEFRETGHCHCGLYVKDEERAG